MTTKNKTDGTEYDELPRVECSCGWVWDIIDAIEDDVISANRVKQRFSSMREGHAYFNRKPGHDLQIIKRSEVTDELFHSLQVDTERSDNEVETDQ